MTFPEHISTGLRTHRLRESAVESPHIRQLVSTRLSVRMIATVRVDQLQVRTQGILVVAEYRQDLRHVSGPVTSPLGDVRWCAALGDNCP